MGPLEKRNKWIIQKAKEIIERKGLTGYLEMEPIPNKFKYTVIRQLKWLTLPF